MRSLGRIHNAAVFGRRVRVISDLMARQIAPNSAVLDVGCGDGSIASLIMTQRPDVRIVGVDVLVRPHTRIKIEQFDGEHLPFPDRSFDVVTFVDVLHHTVDPEILLREARRVARSAIVLKDHCRDGFLAGPTLRIMDWVGNAAHGVVLPYNYWPKAQWQESFARLQLDVTAWNDALSLYPWPASLLFDRRLHFIAALKPRS
jgi:SAM-dependent methyltransferase